MPTLEILSGKHYGQTFSFNEGAKVGKDDSCQVKLSDPGVSRFHAQLKRSGPAVQIEDLGSSNGTYVNFKKRQKGESTTLNDQDIVFFGRTVSKFWTEAPPERAGVSLELLRETVPIKGQPNEADLQAQVRMAEQIEVVRRLRLHEVDPGTLQRLLAASR